MSDSGEVSPAIVHTRAAPERQVQVQDFDGSPTTEATTSSVSTAGHWNATVVELEPTSAAAALGEAGGASSVSGPAMVTAPDPAEFVETPEKVYARPYSSPVMSQ